MSILPSPALPELPDHPRPPRDHLALAPIPPHRVAPRRAHATPDQAALHLLARHSLADDRLTGAEAILLRPLRGSGATASLLDHAATLLRQVAALGHPWDGAAIAIHHPAAFDPGRIIGQVTAAIAASGLAPTRLDLLFPETTLVDLDADGLLALSALRDLGVGLCVDGFGAGLASLTLLRRLPLTRLKLARTLVRVLPDDREEAAILRAVIGTAQAIGLVVIGDGIESERQRAFLAQAGCHEGQGALFGPPSLVTALPGGGLLA